MVRGSIVCLQPVRLLPTFSFACAYNPAFLSIYARHLQPLGFSIPVATQDGAYQRFIGDSAIPGKGEILMWQPRAAAPAGGDHIASVRPGLETAAAT